MDRQTNSSAWGKWAVRLAAAGCTLGLAAATGCGDKAPPLTPEQQMHVSMANPQMQAVLEQLHKDGGKSFSMLTVAQARSGPSAGQAAMEVASAMGKKPTDVGGIADQSMTGRDGNNVTLKVYTPMGNGPFPVLVYYHGGGWVVGSPLQGNPYDASCRALCSMAGCVVVEVDYRLAPDHAYPAAVNDAYDALTYVQKNADKFKSNGKVAVGGESAGGNLAVAVGLMAIDQHTQLPTSILSVYPVGGYNVSTASAQANYNAVPLDTPSLNWFYDKYLPTADAKTARYFDIDQADLHGLPPTTVITDSIDPLHDDGTMLVTALQAAGVTTHPMNYDGVTHEFFGMGQVVDTAKQAEAFAVQNLVAGFGGTTGGMGNMPGM